MLQLYYLPVAGIHEPNSDAEFTIHRGLVSINTNAMHQISHTRSVARQRDCHILKTLSFFETTPSTLQRCMTSCFIKIEQK